MGIIVVRSAMGMDYAAAASIGFTVPSDDKW
jgi:hypothetical protein